MARAKSRELRMFLYGTAKFGIVDATTSPGKIGNKFHGDVARLCEVVGFQPRLNKFRSIIHVVVFAKQNVTPSSPVSL
jgi:hypothetical protein